MAETHAQDDSLFPADEQARIDAWASETDPVHVPYARQQLQFTRDEYARRMDSDLTSLDKKKRWCNRASIFGTAIMALGLWERDSAGVLTGIAVATAGSGGHLFYDRRVNPIGVTGILRISRLDQAIEGLPAEGHL